jgi:hypothetical protein
MVAILESSTMSSPPPMTRADLVAALRDVPDYVWICLDIGPLRLVEKELGASEPFVMLRAVGLCPHGVPKDETCGACESVNEDMRRPAHQKISDAG